MLLCCPCICISHDCTCWAGGSNITENHTARVGGPGFASSLAGTETTLLLRWDLNPRARCPIHLHLKLGLEPKILDLGGDSSPLSFLLLFFCLSRAAPAAYGRSQARGPIGAVAAGLHHSHSNSRSEPCLQPTPQLTATAYP